MVDHTNKLLFKEMDAARFPPECPGHHGTYYYTEYDKIYLTEESGEFEMVTEINVSTYLQSRDEYLSYQFEKRSQTLSHSIQQQLCSSNYQQGTDNFNSHNRFQKSRKVLIKSIYKKNDATSQGTCLQSNQVSWCASYMSIMFFRHRP